MIFEKWKGKNIHTHAHTLRRWKMYTGTQLKLAARKKRGEQFLFCNGEGKWRNGETTTIAIATATATVFIPPTPTPSPINYHTTFHAVYFPQLIIFFDFFCFLKNFSCFFLPTWSSRNCYCFWHVSMKNYHWENQTLAHTQIRTHARSPVQTHSLTHLSEHS